MAEEILYSVRGPKAWNHMTSGELAEAFKRTNVVVVPLGAIEQHGKHLPLGMDTFAIEEMVRRAVLILKGEGKEAIIGPSIPFGPVADRRFPGSINVKLSTMLPLVKDICYSLYEYGAKHIVLAMGHDFTIGALMTAAYELT